MRMDFHARWVWCGSSYLAALSHTQFLAAFGVIDEMSVDLRTCESLRSNLWCLCDEVGLAPL